MSSKVGKYVGIAGYAFQAGSIGVKVLNGESITNADAIGFGVSSVIMGAAFIAAGTAAAPLVGAAALIIGVAELGSYIFTGQSIEQQIFD